MSGGALWDFTPEGVDNGLSMQQVGASFNAADVDLIRRLGEAAGLSKSHTVRELCRLGIEGFKGKYGVGGAGGMGLSSDSSLAKSAKGAESKGLVGRLIEMGDMHDDAGACVTGILIECTRDDLRACDLRIYGYVEVINAEAGRIAQPKGDV